MSQARSVLGALLVAGACAGVAQADTRFDISFDDPTGLYSGYYADLERVTQAAGAAWVSYFADPGLDTSLSVSIGFAAMATASGRSAASAYVGSFDGGLLLYEQGAAHELKTGVDVNGSAPDIEFRIGIEGYLQSELWFDPTPQLRVVPVPADRTDAMSVLLHEFGHALGFGGWRDGSTGALPGSFASGFDALVASAHGATGSLLFLTGTQAMDLYGAPVPLTLGTYAHLGNDAPHPGSDLAGDLMNGVAFYRGTRYEISALDLRVMADLGLPVTTALPEPGALALWVAGLAALVVARRRQLRRTLIAASLGFAALGSTQAQWSVSAGLPSVSIGVDVPVFPQLARVSGYPVYYAPGLQANFFFYDGLYWVYEDDEWYSSTWYDGPWRPTPPEAVPLYVLRVPVRYYRSPPPHFRGWQRDAPPRWGQHWGPAWQSRHDGWDRWSRHSAPAPAPLPTYQRQFPRERYPEIDRQQSLHDQHYRHRRRESVVPPHFREPAAAAVVRVQPPPRAQMTEHHEQRPRQGQPRAEGTGPVEGQPQGRARQQRPDKPERGHGHGRERERGEDDEDRGNGRRK